MPISADVYDKCPEYVAMITVSASLFQSYFRSEREPAINSLLKGNNGSGAEQSASSSLMQSLKENMGLDLRPEQTVKETMFDADAVMDTVLKHVNKRIEHAAANGASDEELEGMLNAARSGVETGFAQAREQIESVGKLSDELGEKIDLAEEGIYQGIDKLEEALFAPLDSAEEDNVPASATNALQYEQSYQRQKNSFSFDLVTQEGDKVTISAVSDYELYEQSLNLENEQGSVNAYGFSENASSGYAFSVQGDLNEAEMTAIQDLLGQVNNLADEFYDGDLATAFDMALELDSDGEQIAQFSLNMQQQQVSAYQFTGARDYGNQDALPRGLMQPLGQFASGLQQARETADQFQQPKQLLQELFKQMDDNPKLHDMLRPMLDKMAA
ncbi:hypothetical protein A9Q73_08490 [Bermanella sp. 47_1433_sub80_T6]|nr:hypothetical protein A9Q73_08490 [Bermanella sp. 47_1433_sub80_T6]